MSETTPPSAPPGPTWLPGIEALRGIAALSVVLHHTWALSTMSRFRGYWIIEGFGSWGVDLFFVLSGYLLAEFFWRPKAPGRKRAFLIRRIFRIAPAYYANVVILMLFFAAHELLFSRQGAKQLLANFTFTHYLFPGTSSSLNVNGALWTLTIEMILYLVMPFMAVAVYRRPVVATGAFIAAGWGYLLYVALAGEPLRRLMFGDTPVTDPASLANMRLYVARQFPGHLALFAIGMIVRWMVVNGKIPSWMRGGGRTPRLSVLTALLVPSVLWLVFIERASDYHRWVWFSGFHIVLAVLFIPVILYASGPAVGAIAPAMRVGVWLGQRSFGIYLWHFPIVLSVLGRGPFESAPTTTHMWARLALILALSILFGAISYRTIEEPARQYGRRASQRLSQRPPRPTTPPEPAPDLVHVQEQR